MLTGAFGTGLRATAEPPIEGDLRKLHALAESEHNSPWKLALREQAYQIARAAGSELEGSRLLVTHRWLGLLLRSGMTNRALAVFESIPTHLRDKALEHPGYLAEVNGLRASWDFADLRLEMAAALVLENRRDLARQLVGDAPPAIDEDRGASALLAMLDRCLEPSETDPFSLFVDVFETAIRDSHVESVTWRRLIASLAARENYPVLARYQNLTAARDLYHMVDYQVRVPETQKTPQLTAAANRAMRAIDNLKSSLEEQAAATSPTPSVDAVGKNIRRLIAAPSIVDLREQPLPNGITPVTPALTRKQERHHGIALRREHKLPFRDQVVRVERRRGSVVALGTSSDYDPLAPLGASGYWVFRSRDGGVSWDRPMYTGLRMLMPYVAVPVSHLPMIGPSGLRLEVKVRDGDPDFIYLPGGFARYRRKEDGLFVELPWELLERDSDGDGLTDLAEERLITDPHEADTDHDHWDDRTDLLPHVPRAVVSDDRVSLMQTILAEADRSTPDAFAHSEQTTFVVGTRAQFLGVQPAQRTIVLSSEEHAAAEAKFGPVFATRIKLMLINRAGNLGYAVWDEGWSGGTGIFEKVGEKWARAGGSGWIS